MPELEWAWGYPAAMLGITLVSVIMPVHFRRQGYL
jgi:Mg2+ and Co2+ transporter CorA